MTIDSHHHLWHYTPDEYGWIDDSMAVIRRDFLPVDLEGELCRAGVDGAVTVQARQSLAETTWLLGLAEKHSVMRGVVGWLPLASRDIDRHLAVVGSHPKLKGIRHVVQDEPDDSFMLGDAFNRGIKAMETYGLVYDILIFERHLACATRFVDRHPNQVFVLDHIAKPKIRDRVVEPWARDLRELAKRDNVCCKVSGMVTEADPVSWTPADLAPYFDTVLDVFGPERLLFGSDWPVCLVGCEYCRWLDIVRGATASLSVAERQAIFGGNAQRVYHL